MIVGNYTFCDYQSIQSAIDYIEDTEKDETFVTLKILEGNYRERVCVRRSNIKLIGIGKVTISYDAHATQKDMNGQDIGTFATPTVILDGSNVHLENLIIENSAGQGDIVGQALALYANCDLSTFKKCTLKGYQDTLFTAPLPNQQKDGTSFKNERPLHEAYRQYYYQCTIEGTVDFIFGGATAYFEQCIIKSKKRDDKVGYITAASTSKDRSYGYVFDECYLVAEEGTAGVYLGRPWRPYANVIFQSCRIDSPILPERWHDWNNSENRQTATFEEYGAIENVLTQKTANDWTVFEKSVHNKIKKKDVFDTPFYD